jgi:hypothetical protein
MWTKEGINNGEHGVRTDNEVGGKDEKNTFE